MYSRTLQPFNGPLALLALQINIINNGLTISLCHCLQKLSVINNDVYIIFIILLSCLINIHTETDGDSTLSEVIVEAWHWRLAGGGCNQYQYIENLKKCKDQSSACISAS